MKTHSFCKLFEYACGHWGGASSRKGLELLDWSKNSPVFQCPPLLKVIVLLWVYLQHRSTIQYGRAPYNFPQQLCIQMFEGWLQCCRCERLDLYSIYSSPKAWIISDFVGVRNIASISQLTFMLHGVKDECLMGQRSKMCRGGRTEIWQENLDLSAKEPNHIISMATPLLAEEQAWQALGFWHTRSLEGEGDICDSLHSTSFLRLWSFSYYRVHLALWGHIADPFTGQRDARSINDVIFWTQKLNGFWEPWINQTLCCMSNVESIYCTFDHKRTGPPDWDSFLPGIFSSCLCCIWLAYKCGFQKHWICIHIIDVTTLKLLDGNKNWAGW